MEKSKKQYFNEINIMRGMAVLCVVIGHSFNPTETPTILGFIKSFVYCFHMPAFFFISGFLEGEKRRSISEKKQAIVKKAKRLMVPYFFLTVVTALLKLLFGAFARNPLNYSTLAVDVLIGRNNPNGGLWFLYALFVISIFGILFDSVSRTVLAGVMFVYQYQQCSFVGGSLLLFRFLCSAVQYCIPPKSYITICVQKLLSDINKPILVFHGLCGAILFNAYSQCNCYILF